MNQIIDGNCNYLYSNSFLQMSQFNCQNLDYPNELNANSFMNGNGSCTSLKRSSKFLGFVTERK